VTQIAQLVLGPPSTPVLLTVSTPPPGSIPPSISVLQTPSHTAASAPSSNAPENGEVKALHDPLDVNPRTDTHDNTNTLDRSECLIPGCIIYDTSFIFRLIYALQLFACIWIVSANSIVTRSFSRCVSSLLHQVTQQQQQHDKPQELASGTSPTSMAPQIFQDLQAQPQDRAPQVSPALQPQPNGPPGGMQPLQQPQQQQHPTVLQGGMQPLQQPQQQQHQMLESKPVGVTPGQPPELATGALFPTRAPLFPGASAAGDASPAGGGYPSSGVSNSPAVHPDWEQHRDPATGRAYYVDRVTKTTSWQPPPPAAMPGASIGPASIPTQKKKKFGFFG